MGEETNECNFPAEAKKRKCCTITADCGNFAVKVKLAFEKKSKFDVTIAASPFAKGDVQVRGFFLQNDAQSINQMGSSILGYELRVVRGRGSVLISTIILSTN